MQTGLNVVQHGQVGKQADVLERARHTHLADVVRFFTDQVLSIQTDTAVRWAVHAGQHIEHGRLACAVRPDQADQTALFNFHAQLIDGAQAAEGNAKRGHFQHSHRYAPPFSLFSSFSICFIPRFSNRRALSGELLNNIIAISRIA